MKVVCTFFFLLIHFCAVAQYQKIVPVTPEAAALTKIVDFPVDLNTGVPNINVPFYTIKTGGLTLPVGLSYHAGGFKVSEQATRAGLGWSLTCELQVARIVNGLDDFAATGYFYNTRVKAYDPFNPGYGGYPFKNQSSDFISRDEYLLAMGLVDGQPDKFSYQLLNKSGSFYIQKDASGNPSFVPVPFENIRIEFDNGRFVITDTDGTVYYFGETGGGTIADRATRGAEYAESSGTLTRTAWKCKKVVNVTQTAEIGFQYALKGTGMYRKATDYIEYYHSLGIAFDDIGGSDCGTHLVRGDENPAAQYSTYEYLLGAVPFMKLSSPKYMEYFGNGQRRFHMLYLNSQLNQIEDKIYNSGNGGWGFSPISNVHGISLMKITFNGGAVDFVGIDQLSSISVRDKFNNTIKTASFHQSLATPVYLQAAQSFNGNNYYGTAYLDSFLINGADIYRFAYKLKVPFGNHLIGHDAWGYRNSQTTEISSYPADYASNVPRQSDLLQKHMTRFPYSCTEIPDSYDFSVGGSSVAEMPNGEQMAYGTLQRIVYPTGGYTDFDLEPNKYNEKVNIFNDDQPNLDAIPRMGGGLRIRSISYYDGVNQSRPAWQKIFKYGEMQNGMGIALNKPAAVFNEREREYNAFSYEQYIGYVQSEVNCGNPAYGCLRLIAAESKKTLAPASYLNYAYASGAPIYYTKVTEYQYDLGVESGKKEYAYYRPGAFNLIDGIPPLELMHLTGIIDGTNISWQHTSGMMGKLKSESTFRYEDCRLKLIHQKNYNYKPYVRPQRIRVAYAFPKTFYQIVSGPEPTAAGGVYNDLVSFTGVSTPPAIYQSGEYGIAVGNLLLEQEEEKWFDGNTTLTNSITYHYDNGQYIHPSRVTWKNGKGELLEKQLRYTYDLSADPVLNTMLGKNWIDPVIEETLKKVSTNQELSKTKSAYASFSAGPGFIAQSAVLKSYGGASPENEITFEQYDQWANPLQLKTRDQVVKSYVWAYDGQYPVSEVVGMSYADVNAVVNPGGQPPISGSYDGTDINARVAALRSAVGNDRKFVSTFTYQPLVGVTSKTDMNGRKEFYEYDAASRLKLVKDNDGKILKQFDYHTVGLTSTSHQNGNFYTHPDNARPVLPAACSSAVQRITVTLQTYVPPIWIPSPDTNIEFYQDGFFNEVGAFPVVSTGNMYTNQVSVPIGIHEIRFVPTASYDGPEVKYFYTTPAAPSTFIRIYSGSVINFQPSASGSYEFYADNTGTISE